MVRKVAAVAMIVVGFAMIGTGIEQSIFGLLFLGVLVGAGGVGLFRGHH
jgi:hypothetical protein